MTEPRIIETITEEVYPLPLKTDSEARDLCCHDVDYPRCRETVRPWGGLGRDDILDRLGIALDDDGKDSNGNVVELRIVLPPGGSCGDEVTEVVDIQGNCCDGVVSLDFDDGSADIIAPSSSAVVIVTGGRLPLSVSVRGKGFFLNSGHTFKDGLADGRAIAIYTDSTACGSCSVSVTDGCTADDYYLRCTVGRWSGLCTVTYITPDCWEAYGGFYSNILIGCSGYYDADTMCGIERNGNTFDAATRIYAGSSPSSITYRSYGWSNYGTWDTKFAPCLASDSMGPLCDDLNMIAAQLAQYSYVTRSSLPPGPIHGPAPKGTSCNGLNNPCLWVCP